MTLLLGFLVDLIITKLESSGNSDKIGDLQIKAPRSKLPAFDKTEVAAHACVCGCTRETDARCCLNVLMLVPVLGGGRSAGLQAARSWSEKDEKKPARGVKSSTHLCKIIPASARSAVTSSRSSSCHLSASDTPSWCLFTS